MGRRKKYVVIDGFLHNSKSDVVQNLDITSYMLDKRIDDPNDPTTEYSNLENVPEGTPKFVKTSGNVDDKPVSAESLRTLFQENYDGSGHSNAFLHTANGDVTLDTDGFVVTLHMKEVEAEVFTYESYNEALTKFWMCVKKLTKFNN